MSTLMNNLFGAGAEEDTFNALRKPKYTEIKRLYNEAYYTEKFNLLHFNELKVQADVFFRRYGWTLNEYLRNED